MAGAVALPGVAVWAKRGVANRFPVALERVADEENNVNPRNALCHAQGAGGRRQPRQRGPVDVQRLRVRSGDVHPRRHWRYRDQFINAPASSTGGHPPYHDDTHLSESGNKLLAPMFAAVCGNDRPR